MELNSARILGQDEVRVALLPHERELYNVVEAAVARWRSSPMGMVAHPTPRFRANAIHELMVDEARVRFADVSGVKFLEASARKMLWIAPGAIDRPIAVQFKKLSDRNCPSNYPTQTALRFDRQLPVPGIPANVRVTVGYRLVSLSDELARVSVVYMNGKSPAWAYDIEREETATVLPLPGTTRRAPVRLRPKDGVVIPLRPKTSEGDNPSEV